MVNITADYLVHVLYEYNDPKKSSNGGGKSGKVVDTDDALGFILAVACFIKAGIFAKMDCEQGIILRLVDDLKRISTDKVVLLSASYQTIGEMISQVCRGFLFFHNTV